MLPDPFQAKFEAPSTSEVVYPWTLMSMANGSSVRKVTDSTDVAAKIMKISHNTVGKGATLRNRHLVRLESYVVEDGNDVLTKPIALYAVADIPATGVTDAQMTSMFKQFVALLRGSSGHAANNSSQTFFFDRWLAGEV